MIRFAVGSMALAISLAVAPRLSAQSRVVGEVCRDGTVAPTTNPNGCMLHGGLDQQATNRGVYGTNGTAGNRGVYGTNGTTSNRGIYNGGTVNGTNREIYGPGNSGIAHERNRERARQRELERERAERARWERARERRDQAKSNRDRRDDDRRYSDRHNDTGRYSDRRGQDHDERR
jgi:hypothetical protein